MNDGPPTRSTCRRVRACGPDQIGPAKAILAAGTGTDWCGSTRRGQVQNGADQRA